jgi:hypothetical protein
LHLLALLIAELESEQNTSEDLTRTWGERQEVKTATKIRHTRHHFLRRSNSKSPLLVVVS